MEKKEQKKKKSFPYGTVGLSLEVINLLLLPRITEINLPMAIISGSLVAKSIIDRTKAKELTPSTKEIIDLYQIFLEEYHKLNKTFEIKDPIELYSLFIYMLRKGYFSHTKKFEFSEVNLRDMEAIMGANIMTGRGVCKHISTVLTDVMRKEDLEAHNVCVYHRDYRIIAIGKEKDYWTKEEIDAWIDERFPEEKDNQKVKKDIYQLLDQGLHITLEMIPVESRNIIERMIGNHMINVVRKGDFIYYLDPTNEKIYRPSKKKDCLEEFEVGIPIKRYLTKSFNSEEELNEIEKLLGLNLPTVSQEEEQARKKRVERIIQENPDLLEAFYEEHKELYEDISNKVLSIRKIGPVLITKN